MHIEDDRGDERRGDDSADAGAGIDEAHRGRAVFHGKPLGDDPRGGREAAAFADPEEQAARGEGDDAAGEAVARAGERPKNHDDEKPAPRAEDIQQPAAADIHEAVGEEKRGVEQRLDRIGNRDLALNLADGDGQRLPVEIADRDGGADEDGDGPAAAAWAAPCKTRGSPGYTITMVVRCGFHEARQKN